MEKISKYLVFVIVIGLAAVSCEKPLSPTEVGISDDFVNLRTDGETKFFDNFENGLSKWTGKFYGSHNGVIVEDPLRPDNHVLTFTALNFGGDVFSSEVTVQEGVTCILTFEYLGLPVEGSVENDLGGAIGFATDLNYDYEGDWIRNRFLAGTSYFGNLPPQDYGIEDDMLIDDGQWHKYRIEFDPYKSAQFYEGPVDDKIVVEIEDWFGSAGVPGDAYFDKVKLKVKKK